MIIPLKIKGEWVEVETAGDLTPPRLTPEQVAARFQVEVCTVLDWGTKGDIRRIKIGRTVRFSREAILAAEANPSKRLSKVMKRLKRDGTPVTDF